MKRREFIKLATASVALAAIPISIASAIASPEEIEWDVFQDPGYAYAYRIMGSVDINGRTYTSSYIAEPLKGSEVQEIDKIKALIMQDIDKAYSHA